MNKGLNRVLTSGQMSMIALGSAIGTGLFLGSAFAIQFAGPAILLSYFFAGVLALILMGALAQMSIINPSTASFATFADRYIHPIAGFVMRYNYWGATLVGVGLEVTASALYMNYWFPAVAAWVWIIVFSAALISINLAQVNVFGQTEYWFSMIKVSAIVAFIIIAVAYLLFSGDPQAGINNYRISGELMPKGWWGVWCGTLIALFGYLGTETIAVAAGEAKDPAKVIPRALKLTVFRLLIFYIFTLALMLAIVPWNQAGVDHSPFVTVMAFINIPAAAGIMNFVILVAALSAMNSQIYIATRMLFSLSEAGYAPGYFRQLSSRRIPVRAMSLSLVGIAGAALLNAAVPKKAYLIMVSLVVFGGLFNWMMILCSHYAFRRSEPHQQHSIRLIGFPYLNLLAILLLAALLLSTYFIPVFHYTLFAGIPWIGFLCLAFSLWFYRQSS